MNELNTPTPHEQAVLLANDRIAHAMAHKYKTCAEYDDLVQAARIGMLRAIRTYDPRRKVKLCTHLYNQARSEVTHFLRANRGIMHIPEKIGSAVNKDTIPRRCEWPEDYNPAVYEDYGTLNTRAVLMDAIRRLTPREQEAVKYYYFDGLYVGEVGKRMGVTQVRATQLCNKAVRKLRAILEHQKISKEVLLSDTGVCA